MVSIFALPLKRCKSDSLDSSRHSLPSTDKSTGPDIAIPEDYLKLLDDDLVKKTSDLLVEAQYQTRVRVEPILEEMGDFLKSFDVADD